METVSVYLLCCGLAEAGTPLSRDNLASVWNGSAKQLDDGLKALEARGILSAGAFDPQSDSLFTISEHSKWKCH